MNTIPMTELDFTENLKKKRFNINQIVQILFWLRWSFG